MVENLYLVENHKLKKMKTDTLLVPTDFSEIADNALEHALELAKAIPASITLLHIVRDEDDTLEFTAKLKAKAEEASQRSGVEVNSMVAEGTVYDEIGGVAEDIDAHMIVMGTHGIRGWQFLTGSRALRIITKSKTPFIVVQERPPRVGGFDHIALPIDLAKEEKQKLKYVVEIAKYFDGKIHILSPEHKDEFLANQARRNLNYATDYLNKQEVNFEIETTNEINDFDRATIRFASKIDADLICIVNHEESAYSMFGNSFEQKLITNDSQIPVMVINERVTTRAGRIIGT